jgi:hypothetical protein
MHFLIGFLIVCVISAVPSLRSVALFLIGLVAVAVLILVLKAERENAPPPPPDPDQLARQAKARECIATQLPSLEAKLQALERSITDDMKFDTVRSLLREIPGSEPATALLGKILR